MNNVKKLYLIYHRAMRNYGGYTYEILSKQDFAVTMDFDKNLDLEHEITKEEMGKKSKK